MTKTATMTIRLDPEVKATAERVYAHYGMTLSEAINVFLHQSILSQGLPFDLRPSPVVAEPLPAIPAPRKTTKAKGKNPTPAKQVSKPEAQASKPEGQTPKPEAQTAKPPRQTLRPEPASTQSRIDLMFEKIEASLPPRA